MKLRVIGGLLMMLCVLVFQPGAPTLTQQLLIPLGMAVGTALIVRNLLAVLITAALLGLIQTNWAEFVPLLKGTLFGISAGGAASTTADPLAWVAGLAYPLLAMASLLLALGILGARFRRHIAATRAVREARRGNRPGPDPGQEADSHEGGDTVPATSDTSATSDTPNPSGTPDADQERPHEG